MPKLNNNYTRRLSQERNNQIVLSTVAENPYEKIPAELQVGSWYRGVVVSNIGQPVVSISFKHCKVPLRGCCEKLERGDTVLFEVIQTRGYLAKGEFRELLARRV
jgi:hypothetical protein